MFFAGDVGCSWVNQPIELAGYYYSSLWHQCTRLFLLAIDFVALKFTIVSGFLTGYFSFVWCFVVLFFLVYDKDFYSASCGMLNWICMCMNIWLYVWFFFLIVKELKSTCTGVLVLWWWDPSSPESAVCFTSVCVVGVSTKCVFLATLWKMSLSPVWLVCLFCVCC